MSSNHTKLFYRLIVGNLAIVAVILSVAAAVSYHSLNAQYLREIEGYHHQLTGIAEHYLERIWPLPEPEMDRLCKEFVADPPAEVAGAKPDAAPKLPIRLTVIATDGRVLGDSQSDPATMDNHKTPDRPEILDALEGCPGQDTRRSKTLTTPYRYVALPLNSKGQIVGAVRISMPVVAISQAQTVIRDTIIWTAVMCVVAFAAVGLLANWVWYALTKRTRAAKPPTDPM